MVVRIIICFKTDHVMCFEKCFCSVIIMRLNCSKNKAGGGVFENFDVLRTDEKFLTSVTNGPPFSYN